MPTTPGRGGFALARAVARQARRVNDENRREVSLAVVTDPRPNSLSAKIIGFDETTPMTASDLFDIFPLEMTDVVVVVPIPGGSWCIVSRLTGAEPEINLAPEEIDGSVMQVGEPFTRDGAADGLSIAYRSPAPVSIPGPDDTLEVVWTFEKPFDLIPVVVVGVEVDSDDPVTITASVKDVTETECTLMASNSGAAHDAVLVAIAIGVV